MKEEAPPGGWAGLQTRLEKRKKKKEDEKLILNPSGAVDRKTVLMAEPSPSRPGDKNGKDSAFLDQIHWKREPESRI